MLEGPDAANEQKVKEFFTDGYGLKKSDAIFFAFDKSKASAKNRKE